MKYLLYLSLLISALLRVEAQDEPPAGEIEDAQIIIEKDKPLTLPKASRIYLKSQLRPVSQDTVSLSFNLSRPQVSLATTPFQPVIKTYQVAGEESDSWNYFKGGFGNYLSPLLQGYGGWDINEQTSAGAYFYHESFATGPVRKEESAYANTLVGLTGRMSQETMSLAPVISFENESFYYYGRADGDSAEITDRVNLNHFYLAVPIDLSPSDEWLFSFKPSFQAVGMGSGGSTFNQDIGVALEGTGSYQLSDQWSAFTRLNLTNWQYTSGFSSTRTVFDINPGVRFSTDQFSVKAGALVTVGKDDSTNAVNVYPDVAIDFMATDQLSIFVDAAGGLYSTNINDLRLQNRYLDDSLTLLNQNNQIKLTAGVTYALRSDLSLEPFVGYSFSTYQPLFYHSVADSSRFGVAYASDGLGTTSFGATVRWINNRSSLLGRMIIYSYQVDQFDEAWYLPTTELQVSYSQQLSKKFTVQSDLTVLQGIKAPSPTDGSIVELPTILDLSLEGTYSFNKNWSGFLRMNNVLGTKYERYLNYPTRGFTIKAGVIYRF